MRSEVVEGDSGLQCTCTALGEDGEAESCPQHRGENTPEFNYLSGEAIDNENNACYLNQGESMTEASIMREMSAQPLLELTPMTGNVNDYVVFTIFNYAVIDFHCNTNLNTNTNASFYFVLSAERSSLLSMTQTYDLL